MNSKETVRTFLKNKLAERFDNSGRFTVKVYRDTSYINEDGEVKYHYDICTAFSINNDYSINSQLGIVPAGKWEHYL